MEGILFGLMVLGILVLAVVGPFGRVLLRWAMPGIGPLGRESSVKSIAVGKGGDGRSVVLLFVAKFLISVCVLGAALFVVLSKGYNTDTFKWACGAIGTILGYWLGGGGSR